MLTGALELAVLVLGARDWDAIGVVVGLDFVHGPRSHLHRLVARRLLDSFQAQPGDGVRERASTSG